MNLIEQVENLMNNFTTYLILIIITAAAISCNTVDQELDKQAEVENKLSGSKWTLEEMKPNGVDPVFFELNENSPGIDYFLLYFESDARLQTVAGCNLLYGSYELEAEGKINVTSLGGSRASCDFTLTYSYGLIKAQNYVIEDDTLIISHGKIPFDGDSLTGKFIFSKGFEYWDPWENQ